MAVNPMKTRIYLMDTEQLRDPDTAERVYQALPEKRRKAADRYRYPEDRLRSLASGALLLKLCETEGLSPAMEDLTENAYGKPCFSAHPEICFNLSHSGSKVILGVSDRAIGCDIEIIHDTPIIQEIARNFFSPEEYQTLMAETDPAARCRLFYRLWTLRESFVKETGLGLYLSLKSFRIHIDPEGLARVQLTGLPEARFREYVSENVSFFEYNIDERYCCSCCIAQDGQPYERPDLIPYVCS